MKETNYRFKTSMLLDDFGVYDPGIEIFKFIS